MKVGIGYDIHPMGKGRKLILGGVEVPHTQGLVGQADADALVQLETAARQHQIPVCLVHDAGRTVIPAGTITCLGLGPALADVLDPITGELPLV